MGVPENSMFCSSISEIGVPVKDDIYEYLRYLLDSEQVIPILCYQITIMPVRHV